jgi:ERCC4-type nuclease
MSETEQQESNQESKVQIIIDDREHAVIPHFNNFTTPPDITFKVERVNIGDYSVLYKGHILMIIERKSWKDLSASIKDGRKDNVNKMLKLRTDVGCQIFYLIEGNPLPKSNTRFSRIPYKNLRSHLDHLMIRDNIHIIHSKDQKNTVERIFELIQNYLTIKPSPLLKFDELDKLTTGGSADGIAKLKEKIVVSADSIIYKIWCCVPNITEKTSALFINKNHHIADLILGNITEEQIYALKYDNGYIIGVRSKKIWNGSRIKPVNNKHFSKMLTQINGITKQTANIILNTISIEELLKGEITLGDLSVINKTATAKVGKKSATQILKYFVPIQKEYEDEHQEEIINEQILKNIT